MYFPCVNKKNYGIVQLMSAKRKSLKQKKQSTKRALESLKHSDNQSIKNQEIKQVFKSATVNSIKSASEIELYAYPVSWIRTDLIKSVLLAAAMSALIWLLTIV